MIETPLIHLSSRNVTLVLEPVADSPPVWRHFGQFRPKSPTAWPAVGNRPRHPTKLDLNPSLTVLPTHGFGWFGQPALVGSRPGARGDLDWAQSFDLADCQQEGNALVLTLTDAAAGLAVTISYTLDADSDVLTTWAELENRGDTPFRLDWLAAASIPLPTGVDQVMGFSGRWTLEFQESRELLGAATWRRDNRCGRTSHGSFPGIIVGPALADDAGHTIGAHLGWSGNHTLIIEPVSDGRRQMQLGEWLAPGEVVLGPGERYRTPDAFVSFSPRGLNGLSANFHRFVRERVIKWPGGAMAPRPVHLNTWEAVYFDQDPEGLKALASAGADVGVERFVLDDGWFHGRDGEYAALGDWWPDERKYPEGLKPLVDHVRDLGMQFGLWVEPEMVSPNSNLYRAHPDWAFHLEGRPVVLGRNQLVLDLARDDVCEYLFEKLDGLLTEYPIAYLKWDMNRDLAAAGHFGMPGYRRQTDALYGLLSRLRAAHPGIEIESCASGGARADYGVLAHTNRIWPSDCNDAVARVSIQSGFLRFFPPELMGAHIGPDFTHTTGRRHSMAFRAAVALFGHLGIEQDVRLLESKSRAELAHWIGVYKQWRDLLHSGVLRQGFSGQALRWLQVTSEDRSAALWTVYRMREENARDTPVMLVDGLDPDRDYRVEPLFVSTFPYSTATTEVLDTLAAGELVLSGAVLRDYGLPLPPQAPESAAVIGLRAI